MTGRTNTRELIEFIEGEGEIVALRATHKRRVLAIEMVSSNIDVMVLIGMTARMLEGCLEHPSLSEYGRERVTAALHELRLPARASESDIPSSAKPN